jgi:hypothetical protein
MGANAYSLIDPEHGERAWTEMTRSDLWARGIPSGIGVGSGVVHRSAQEGSIPRLGAAPGVVSRRHAF